MKVLLIGHERDLNGASKSLLNIIDELLKRNYTIYLLTSYTSGALFEELSKRNVIILVEPFHRWCVYKGGRKKWFGDHLRWVLKWERDNKKTAKKIAQLVKEESIDIIHTNTSVINIGGLISKYSGVRHIWHIREFADLDFNMFPLVPKSRYYGFMNKYSSAFICISNAVAEHYHQLEAAKKKVIYNGIDHSFYIKRDDHFNSEKTVQLLIAGRISKTKGQQEAIDACQLLSKEGICEFRLMIAGHKNSTLHVPDSLKELVVELGNVTNIQKVREHIDIELVCSKAEAFGRVTAEAMMAGIPVIGSNTGGTPELIIDGETGFLYEQGNVEDLASKIQKLIKDPALRHSMGERAQEYAKKNFTIERCVDEIEGIYREALEA